MGDKSDLPKSTIVTDIFRIVRQEFFPVSRKRVVILNCMSKNKTFLSYWRRSLARSLLVRVSDGRRGKGREGWRGVPAVTGVVRNRRGAAPLQYKDVLMVNGLVLYLPPNLNNDDNQLCSVNCEYIMQIHRCRFYTTCLLKLLNRCNLCYERKYEPLTQ